VSNGREKNPIVKIKDTLEYTRFPYKVQASKDGKNFKDFVGTSTKDVAIQNAKQYAKNNPKEYVRVFKIDVSEDFSDEVKKKS
jgi:ribulose bisphosphate carboxylase small subunit